MVSTEILKVTRFDTVKFSPAVLFYSNEPSACPVASAFVGVELTESYVKSKIRLAYVEPVTKKGMNAGSKHFIKFSLYYLYKYL